MVLVMSQEDERISTPMKVFQKIVLPWVIQPGLAPPIKIRNPPQTKSIAATGGISPIRTKSIMFLKSLKRSQRVHSAGLADVPHGTNGHQLTACAKTGKKIIVLIVLVFIFLPVFVHAVSWWPLVPCLLNPPPSPN